MNWKPILHVRPRAISETATASPSAPELSQTRQRDPRILGRLERDRHRLANEPDVVTDEQRAAAFGSIIEFATGLAGQKRSNPGDDLSSVLLSAEVDGTKLSDPEFAAFVWLLVDAGSDTTRNAMGAGLLKFLNAPDQWDALRTDIDTHIGGAVEEILRMASPVVHMRRSALQPVEVAGQLIEPGQKVVMMFGAANHDPERFEDPLRFDIYPRPEPSRRVWRRRSALLSWSAARTPATEDLLDRTSDHGAGTATRW